MLSPPQSVWRRRLLLAPAAVMIALIARELLPFSRSRRDLQAVLADRGHAWVAIRPDESAPAASVEFSGTRVDAELVEAIAEESVRKGRVADNVGKVVCFGGSLTADGIDSLSRWPALTQLSLENVEPPAAPILHGFERLREVKLQGMTLTQTFAAALASSPGLRTVRLDFVALERGALTALCRGRGLGELHLDEALMAPGELSALSLASNLRVLTLAPRHGSPDNAASLSPLASLPHLERLTVGAALGRPGPERLIELTRCPHVTELKLCGAQWKLDWNPDQIKFPQVEHLTIEAGAVSNRSLRTIAACCPNLKSMRFDGHDVLRSVFARR